MSRKTYILWAMSSLLWFLYSSACLAEDKALSLEFLDYLAAFEDMGDGQFIDPLEMEQSDAHGVLGMDHKIAEPWAERNLEGQINE